MSFLQSMWIVLGLYSIAVTVALVGSAIENAIDRNTNARHATNNILLSKSFDEE